MSSRALVELYERYLPRVTETSIQNGLWPAVILTTILCTIILWRFGLSGLLLIVLMALAVGVYFSPMFSAVIGILFYTLIFYGHRWYSHWYERFLK